MTIIWKDEEKEYDPAPEMNELERKLITLEDLLKGSKIKEVQEAFNDVFNQYKKATKEFIDMYNEMEIQLKQLKAENMELQENLNKWNSQKGKGKRTSRKLLDKKEDILNWKKAGISTREIARNIGVSEGTIRRLLKTSNQP
jgi:DNA-binding NarL/FixJ family response regulator